MNMVKIHTLSERKQLDGNREKAHGPPGSPQEPLIQPQVHAVHEGKWGGSVLIPPTLHPHITAT